MKNSSGILVVLVILFSLSLSISAGDSEDQHKSGEALIESACTSDHEGYASRCKALLGKSSESWQATPQKLMLFCIRTAVDMLNILNRDNVTDEPLLAAALKEIATKSRFLEAYKERIMDLDKSLEANKVDNYVETDIASGIEEKNEFLKEVKKYISAQDPQKAEEISEELDDLKAGFDVPLIAAYNIFSHEIGFTPHEDDDAGIQPPNVKTSVEEKEGDKLMMEL